jgi:hypothetical protein
VKWAFAAVCGYETAAVCSGRLPTITALCQRRRVLAAAVVAALAVHLWLADQPAPAPPRLPGRAARTGAGCAG